jgi:hypothetical protein
MTVNLPQQRNIYFVGRGEFLLALHKELFEKSEQTRNTVVITGIGGVGKSQLATEYIYLHRSEFSSIFWIDAGSEDLIRQSFERIAMDLLREYKSRKLEGLDDAFDAFESAEGRDRENRAGRLVMKWLSYPDNTQWLIVLTVTTTLRHLALTISCQLLTVATLLSPVADQRLVDLVTPYR